MKTIALIAEYNPFHAGHYWQIQEIKNRFGQDCRIIVCMSGNFVQRGEAAILAKEERAKIAIEAGVSLVLELPVLFSTASAREFATGAIRLLHATGIVNTVVCGSEFPTSHTLLKKISRYLIQEDAYREALLEKIRSGMNYVQAREVILTEQFKENAAEIKNVLHASNSILALEYQMAMDHLNQSINEPKKKFKLHLLERKGVENTDDLTQGSGVSATAIREILRKNKVLSKRVLLLEKSMPSFSLSSLVNNTLVLDDSLDWKIPFILQGREDQESANIRDMDIDLIARIRKIENSSASTNIANAASTRYFPESRIRRAILSWKLGIKKEDWEMVKRDGPAFIRVLAFDKNGRYMLKLMRKLAILPRIDKSSDLLESKNDTVESASYQREKERLADSYYSSLLSLT